MSAYQIAVMEGDGIGPEIVQETIKVLYKIQDLIPELELKFTYYPIGLTSYEKNGSTLPKQTIEGLKNSDAGILGPLTTHVYEVEDENMINPSGKLRKDFDLYANIRPAKNYEGVPSLYKDVDLIIVRENTQGMYADRNLYYNTGEFMPDPDTVLSMRVVTRKASERIAKIGFELAKERKNKVTLVHKMNVLRKGCGLFYESSHTVGKEYHEVEIEDYHVDAFAMHLTQRPQAYDVIVTTNMFGDILSDQAAGLIGGLGLAPGLNVGDSLLLAQATHGSAPDIAGENKANPISAILSVKMMLEWMGIRYKDENLKKASLLIDRGVESTLSQEKKTVDIGGKLSTNEFGDQLIKNI